MNRREALKRVGLLLGGTVISSQLFLTACSTENNGNRSNDSFLDSDVDLLNEIAETIIPETDTPGAKAAGVGSFMAMMVPDCYTEQNQENFRKGLEKVRSNFQKEYGKTFTEASVEERREFLNKLDSEMNTYTQIRHAKDPEHYFRIMKELVLLGYFTSEIGCREARRYVQTPGSYEACIEYEDGARAWMSP